MPGVICVGRRPPRTRRGTTPSGDEEDGVHAYAGICVYRASSGRIEGAGRVASAGRRAKMNLSCAAGRASLMARRQRAVGDCGPAGGSVAAGGTCGRNAGCASYEMEQRRRGCRWGHTFCSRQYVQVSAVVLCMSARHARAGGRDAWMYQVVRSLHNVPRASPHPQGSASARTGRAPRCFLSAEDVSHGKAEGERASAAYSLVHSNLRRPMSTEHETVDDAQAGMRKVPCKRLDARLARVERLRREEA